MRTLFRQMNQALNNGQNAVLVTVVASSGSTPRGAGARMLITEQGRLAGTIGGGAVEYRSEQMAAELLKTGSSRLEFFQLHKNQVLDLGMVCGGDVHVYFRYFKSDDPSAIALTQAVESAYRSGEQSWLITEVTLEKEGGMAVYSARSGLKGAEVPQQVIDALGNKPATIHSDDGRDFYCEKLVQAGRVYIFGGGHVAQALVPALSAVDFRCTVLEDREDFCSPELFRGVEETILIDNNKITEYVTITEDDYVVIMTRGHKDDMIVQAQAMRTPANYIGVIGSRHKIASVRAKLMEMGFGEEDFQRVTTPIGLDIKAETPAEIAVSITAQLIQHRAMRLQHLTRMNG